MKIIQVAEALLREHAVCDHCLGRQFAMLGHGLTNEERGNAIKLLLVIEECKRIREGDISGHDRLISIAINGSSVLASTTLEALGIPEQGKPLTCQICEGVLDLIDGLAQEAIKKLNAFEFESFLVGIIGSSKVEEREDELRVKFNIKWGENIRSELSREIGKRIMETTGKRVNFGRPDILVLVNPFMEKVSLKVNPLFISGRYRKFVRCVPQSPWNCSECEGEGCEKCNWTGRRYPNSIEEVISKPLLKRTGGEAAKLHTASREPVQTRVLGTGRAFIIEVKKPKKRKINLDAVKDEITQEAEGKIEVEGLDFTSKEAIKRLKDNLQVKTLYRAVIEFQSDIPDELITKVKEELKDITIHQTPPPRNRRSRRGRVRRKHIYGIELRRVKPNIIEMLICCQGGINIRDVIMGRETTPSVAKITGLEAKSVEIDLVDLEGGDTYGKITWL